MRRLWIGLLASALVAIVAASTVLAAPSGAVQQAKQATARFNSTVQAVKAGYGPFPEGVPLHECIMALDGSGGMGYHWVNGSLLDASLDPANPEVLVYAPKGNGKLELVALEYVIFDAAVPSGTTPMIFGQSLTFVPDGNRYEIPAFWQRHIWLYDHNSAGLFEDFNPDVTC